MGVFAVLLLVPIVVQHIGIKGYHINYEQKNRRILAFFFAFLTFLVMFRHESIGNDTRNYIYYFNNIKGLSWRQVSEYSLETGFAYFNKIVSLFSAESRFFLAATAVVTSAMIYPTYKRLCLDASLTIVLYCILSTFVMMFSGLRQMMAIAIGFASYEFTRKKKLGTFIISVIVAILFHTSAFILAFMYPLYHARITKKWLLAVVPALVLVFIFNEPIFTTLGLILERYTEFSGEIVRTGAYMMIVLFSIFAVFSFLIPDEARLDEETIGLRNFLLLSLAIQMFAPLNTLAMRMNYYYIIFIPLLLPKVISYRSERWGQVAIAARHIMVVFFVTYFFLNAVTSESALNVFPYHFFWESIG